VRRPALVTALTIVPLLLLWAYGMVRVAAPFGLFGLLFDEPVSFGIAAALFAGASVVLMAIPAVDRRVGRWITNAREPTGEERERLAPLLSAAAAGARMDPRRFHVLIEDDDGVNAAAGGGRILFVTRGALRLPGDELTAVLAHELGHHRDLVPVVTALIWWARLPAIPLRWAARTLRRGVGRVGARLPGPLRLLTVPAQLVVLFVELNLLWLVYVAELIAAWAGRLSEFDADRHAARWGFAAPLIEVLAFAAARTAPPSRLERLLDEHPPPAARVERLVAFMRAS
jgi:Zn-dependent protease with chaperone function